MSKEFRQGLKNNVNKVFNRNVLTKDDKNGSNSTQENQTEENQESEKSVENETA